MKKAILIAIDGCRADAINSEVTPNLVGLMQRGSFTLEAQTVSPSLTLPVHLSLLTSLSPKVHRVVNNEPKPFVKSHWSIFDFTHQRGLTSGMFYNWGPLRLMAEPESLDASCFLNNMDSPSGDWEVVKAGMQFITQKKPDFCSLYLGCLGERGQQYGFDSREYFEQLSLTDQAIGKLIDRLGKRKLLDQYNFVITGDNIWIALGPDFEERYQISTRISLLDCLPTLARLLNLRHSEQWEGRVLGEILKVKSPNYYTAAGSRKQQPAA